MRSDIENTEKNSFICDNHISRLLKSYSFFEKYCFDPLKTPQSKINSQLREVSIDKYNIYLKKFTTENNSG